MKNNFGIEVFEPEKSLGRFGEYDEDYGLYAFQDPFSIDEMKLKFSKQMRSLSLKTQVFNKPYNKNIRTRYIHSDEVYELCKLVSNALNLYTPLCCAEGAGHDSNHFAFGHITEQQLTNRLRKETGCSYLKLDHVLMSLVGSYLIERKCNGLNLMYETMEGILYHSTGGGAFTIDSELPQEYSVLRYVDKIAYLFSDINDAKRLGILDDENKDFRLLKQNLKVLDSCPVIINGTVKKLKLDNQRARVYNCVNALIKESREKGVVSFSEGEVFEAFDMIRSLMYELVYNNIDWDIQNKMIEKIYDILEHSSLNDYRKHCDYRIIRYNNFRESIGLEKVKAEFTPHPALVISLLTDNDVIELINKRITHNQLKLEDILFKTSLYESVPYLLTKDIDLISLSKEWGSYGKENPRRFLRKFLKIE
ncbi:MAG: hypothetical protein JW791_04445 [Nanoarchaeota archaeon]|nr:hypothetical protein [Nanoarchaeota archaeon]